MSIDHAKAFLQELSGNEELKARLSACITPEKRMLCAKESGFEFTAEELNSARTGLSDEKLDAISGGSCCGHTCEPECINGWG